jgi:integrase
LATLYHINFVAKLLPKGAAMARKKFTDRTLKSIKPAAEGKHYDVWDTDVRGLGVRVSDTGRRTFVMLARFGGKGSNPTRRALGEYDSLSLVDAREKAQEWRKLIGRGVDPATELERQRREEERKKENSFAAVAVKFIAYIQRQKLRTAAVMERDLERTFVKAWGARPITEITPDDVKRIIRASVEREVPYQAFHDFALIRRLFNWCIGTDDYGLQFNPCDRLNSKDLIGQRHDRNRVFSDDELRAFWRAIERLKYPYGPLYRILVLTGLRLGEACGAQWPEFDLGKKEWTIPTERMKKVKGGAKPFMVPLTDAMLDLLNGLPRFDGGECLFSNSFGKRALRPNLFSDPKKRLDEIMLDELRKIAIENGKESERVALPDFVNHDIRRTVRTHLSALRIGEEVREAVLAHVRPGIKGTYDKYQYLDEKREALTLWNARLRSIIEPQTANVVELRPATIK